MLGFPDLPSMFELRGLYRTDEKCTDGVTMIPLEIGKQLVWEVTVVLDVTPVFLAVYPHFEILLLVLQKFFPCCNFSVSHQNTNEKLKKNMISENNHIKESLKL